MYIKLKEGSGDLAKFFFSIGSTRDLHSRYEMVIGFFKCSQGREEEHGSLLFLFYLGFILKVLSGIWLYVYSQGRVGNLAQFFSFSMLIQRFNVKE